MASSTTHSKQNQVYDRVRGRLGQGVYPAGHRINVAQIARELGVSSIPVREALRRLEAEGWLEYSRNTGMRVAARDVQTWVELSIPFAVLGGFATAEAAEPLRNTGRIDELRSINTELEAALVAEDFPGVSAANAAFHQRIFDTTPHPELRRSLTETWQRLNVMRREIFGTIPLRAAESVHEHAALIDLIAIEGDGFAIEAAAREHMLRTVRASRISAEAQSDHVRSSARS